MMSFDLKKLTKKSKKLINNVSNIGATKILSPNSIRSIGTARSYAQCVKNYLVWREINGLSHDTQSRVTDLTLYLAEISETCKQKTVCQNRMALGKVYHKKLDFVESKIMTTLDRRAYSFIQFKSVLNHLTTRFAISASLCFFVGLRAHELCTLRKLGDAQPSVRRQWRNDLFSHDKDFALYVVTGKGGLKRVVAVPKLIADILKTLQYEVPKKVTDRGIFYTTYYDIGFGQSLSQSFTKASKKSLGFSFGLHGLRHSYAQNQLRTLIRNNIEVNDAMAIVSQKMGHFRPHITACYFR